MLQIRAFFFNKLWFILIYYLWPNNIGWYHGRNNWILRNNCNNYEVEFQTTISCDLFVQKSGNYRSHRTEKTRIAIVLFVQLGEENWVHRGKRKRERDQKRRETLEKKRVVDFILVLREQRPAMSSRLVSK